MLILNYWDVLLRFSLIMDTLHCFIKLVTYIIPCVVVLLLIRFALHPKQYVFRKLLHAVAFTCVTFMISVAKNWIAASLTSIVIALLIYPILALLENESWFASLFVQKKKGEIKISLLMLFFTIAIITAISWGIFKERYIAIVSILMWGCGDAAAALIGIPYGNHKVKWKLCDGKKSWEGTIGMLVVSMICGMIVLTFYKQTFVLSLIKVGLSSILGSFVELISPSEWDTVTVPSALLVCFIVLESIL